MVSKVVKQILIRNYCNRRKEVGHLSMGWGSILNTTRKMGFISKRQVAGVSGWILPRRDLKGRGILAKPT